MEGVSELQPAAVGIGRLSPLRFDPETAVDSDRLAVYWHLDSNTVAKYPRLTVGGQLGFDSAGFGDWNTSTLGSKSEHWEIASVEQKRLAIAFLGAIQCPESFVD